MSHHRQGQPKNPPPGSTLAALLSSQRRSAAQSDRYRVQRARPFADNSQVARAVGPAPPPAPSEQPRPGRPRASSGQGSTSSSVALPEPAAPPRVGKGGADESSRRVTFGPSSNVIATAAASEQRPRKRKSRWGPPLRPAASTNGADTISGGVSLQQTKGDSLVARGDVSTKWELESSAPDSTPIPKKEGSLPGETDDVKRPLPTDSVQERRDGPTSETCVSSEAKLMPRAGSNSEQNEARRLEGEGGGAKQSASSIADAPTKRTVQSSVETEGIRAVAPSDDRAKPAERPIVRGNNSFPQKVERPLVKSTEPSAKREDSASIPKRASLSDSRPKAEPTVKVDPMNASIRKKRKLPPAMEEGREEGREMGTETTTKKRKRLSTDGPGNGEALPSRTPPIVKQDDSAIPGWISLEVGAEKKKKKKMPATEGSSKASPSKPSTIAKQDDAAISSPSETNASKKTKTKGSPFRVKVGCVVAVRFRKLAQGGNPSIVSVVKEGDGFRAVGKGVNGHDGQKAATKKGANKRHAKQYEVWAVPIPGQDDGLSLLGSWIRCAFPKSFVSKWHKKNNRNETMSPPKRVVEGNVVSILGNDLNGQRGIAVGLLVDGSSLESLPYLEILSDDSPDDTISSSEKIRRKLEAQIRGEDKVLVKVVLAPIIDRREGSKADPGVISQWLVRKRVNAKPAGKKPSKAERKQHKLKAHSLFVGDSTDSPSQQEENWKWIAGRTSRWQESREDDSALGNDNVGDSVPYLVGEMVKMDVTPKHEREEAKTLATVTIKRLWTPEQTKKGRLAHHGTLELFDSIQEGGNELYFQAPVEDLIVIGKGIARCFDGQEPPRRDSSVDDDTGWSFVATHSYNISDGSYTPLCEKVTEVSEKTCHYCQRVSLDSTLQQCNHKEHANGSFWCARCLQLVGGMPPIDDEDRWMGPCCTGTCDCPVCRSNDSANIMMILGHSQSKIGQQFSGLAMALQAAPSVDFALPSDTGQLCLQPSLAPLSGDGKSKSYNKPKAKEGKKSDTQKGKKDAKAKAKKRHRAKLASPKDEGDDYDVFKPLCHRAIPFGQLNQKRWGTSKLRFIADDSKQPYFRENVQPRTIKIGKAEEKTTLTGRAARASQRRMFKSLATLGDVSKNVDRLAGRDREQQLRFDKSRIHGWGVFNNGETINSGDLIIEYRGELIGNAVADKRELEYEKAGLDDYMFRIDAYTVCDATILGNVARYINASCTPNCYTQIITAGENKRIVIYAKRDIQRGEELAYDYKFSLEYDPSKRIPCHCGAPDCRGFMNWDKRYA